MAENEKIEYRVVTPAERLHVARQVRVSFPFPFFDYDEAVIREKIERGEFYSENTYGAVDENGRVLAGMDVIPYSMWFDGQKTQMFGISGVVSLPESRRKGNIRGMFEAAFKDIYEKGAVFSHLFPFSYEYYRQFGYDDCGAAITYSLPIAPARKLKANGTAHEFIEGGAVRGKLIEVYEDFASRHNIMVSRSQERWNDVFKVSLFSYERLYYWTDTSGEVKSWAKFKKDKEKMMISDIVWSDHDSMLGILQFIGMYEGEVETLVLKASPEFIPDLYWGELREIKKEPAWLGMSRVINAKRVLELMKKPDGIGQFTIKITDNMIKQNNAAYTVKYSGGGCTVSAGAGAADIEATERGFTQMALGVYELNSLACKGAVRINSNRETLEKLFVKKPLLLTEMF